MAKRQGYWTGPRSISLSKVRYRHSLTKGHTVPRRYSREPIRVFPRRGLFSTSYLIHDGHHRVRDARAAGRGSIRAYIWKEVSS